MRATRSSTARERAGSAARSSKIESSAVHGSTRPNASVAVSRQRQNRDEQDRPDRDAARRDPLAERARLSPSGLGQVALRRAVAEPVAGRVADAGVGRRVAQEQRVAAFRERGPRRRVVAAAGAGAASTQATSASARGEHPHGRSIAHRAAPAARHFDIPRPLRYDGAMLVNCVAYQNGRKLADIPVEDISEYVSRPDCFVWVAITDPAGDELDQMAEEFGLHELAVEDAKRPHQRPEARGVRRGPVRRPADGRARRPRRRT